MKNDLDSIAIVTPSYLPDLERCALLVESLAHCAPNTPHYLIIDKRDVAAFDHLQSDRTRIIVSESLVPGQFWRLPMRKGLWLSRHGALVRGWIMQQILKIAVANAISENVLVYCDSDVSFLKPFDWSSIRIDGRTGLLDTAYAGGSVPVWTNVACDLLGLESSQITPRGHVGNMICWRRETVLALQRRIEAACGKSWQHAIAGKRTFSEYILYGTFVRNVLGYSESLHAPSDAPLIKHSWGLDLSDNDQLDRFFESFDPQAIGIMMHSKDKIDLAHLRALLVREWQRAPAYDVTSSA